MRVADYGFSDAAERPTLHPRTRSAVEYAGGHNHPGYEQPLAVGGDMARDLVEIDVRQQVERQAASSSQ